MSLLTPIQSPTVSPQAGEEDASDLLAGKRILIATDFSVHGQRALSAGLALARYCRSKVRVVHAVPLTVNSVDGMFIPPDVFDRDVRAAQRSVDQILANEFIPDFVTVRTTVALAEPVDLILQTAETEKSDLIVVGSHGASGLERLVLGSVAETVLRKTKTPVLVIGPNCQVVQHPLRSVVFATDLLTTGTRPALYAARAAERGHGRLTLIHVVYRDSRTPSYQVEAIEQRLQQRLYELIPPDANLSYNPEARLLHGSPAEAISRVARDQGATIIVVGLRPRSVLAEHAPWSTLSHVIREARCGILAVRDDLS